MVEKSSSSIIIPTTYGEGEREGRALVKVEFNSETTSCEPNLLSTARNIQIGSFPSLPHVLREEPGGVLIVPTCVEPTGLAQRQRALIGVLASHDGVQGGQESYEDKVHWRSKFTDKRNGPVEVMCLEEWEESNPPHKFQVNSELVLSVCSSLAIISCHQLLERALKICNSVCHYLYPRDMSKKGILERLAEGVVIGDGGFVFALEKRGYVKAGPWTPEAACENPEAVIQLHREFLRAGADVMQAFTFYACDTKLDNRGHDAGQKFTGKAINKAACDIAKRVAAEGDALVAGGLSQTPTYLSNKGKSVVQEEFKKQVDVFVQEEIDFLICEYFEHVEEIEWAIEVCKKTGKPVAATMCIGPQGDLHGVSAGECGVRMVRAGAEIIGVNCHFDPFIVLDTIKLMKEAVEKAGLKAHLMSQPLAYHTPDAGKQGFIDLPEFPFALEPRVITRWDAQRYAREAYDLGVRYIGGCCGFEPYHTRAISEELTKERGKEAKGTEKHDLWGGGLTMHTKPWVRARAQREFWENLKPASGRPYCASLSQPANWGVTAGSEVLKQQKEATTSDEIKKLIVFKK
uniref:Hcy-binding domain-containing protein n=1 Tax=Timema bartmani TaxID=61472 RepID=A0A7R9F260_9NEOP|nr:unnamed protein product [Timema bartmani]